MIFYGGRDLYEITGAVTPTRRRKRFWRALEHALIVFGIASAGIAFAIGLISVD